MTSDARLRIAIFLRSFPVVSETFILRQITGLIDLGHHVEIFASFPSDASVPQHPQVREYGLTARTRTMNLAPELVGELPVVPLSGKTWPPGSAAPIANWKRAARALPKLVRNALRSPAVTLEVLKPSRYGYQATSLSALYRLDECSRSPTRIDVSHAHFGPVANEVRFVRQLWHAPLVASFHGYDFTTTVREEGMHFYDRLFAEADLVTANSRFTQGRLEALGCPVAKIRQLPVGLDPAAFAFQERTLLPSEPVRVASVGRLVEIKGHEFVIRAIGQLLREGLNFEYHLVGDGGLRRRLQEIATDVGVGPHVIFHGALAQPQVQGVLERAHIFVMPSVSVETDQEGQGLALQEAQAAGLPVIATSHGALPEGLLPGVSGYLVPERDVDALAGRLKYLAQHPELWAALGRAGRDYVVRRYDIGRLNVTLCNIYREAIELFNGDAKRAAVET